MTPKVKALVKSLIYLNDIMSKQIENKLHSKYKSKIKADSYPQNYAEKLRVVETFSFGRHLQDIEISLACNCFRDE